MSQGVVATQAQAPLPYTGRVPNTVDNLSQYNPNRPDAIEAIWQPQYDFQSYPTTGQSQLSFFQVQQGQSGKTFADTNMTLGGQFPSPTAFLCTAIMIFLFPNYAGAVSNVAAAATANANVNDVVKVYHSGWFEFTIGSKVYLRDAPIGKFPPNVGIGGLQAYGLAQYDQAAPSVNQVSTDVAQAIGRYAEITPLLIPMNQNFVVTLNWPALVTVANTARIGVVLDGFYYRQSQ
ncbi:MAG: hypothetical protein ACRD33_00105 [Candidatus Acidiferrales bacterium]